MKRLSGVCEQSGPQDWLLPCTAVIGKERVIRILLVVIIRLQLMMVDEDNKN